MFHTAFPVALRSVFLLLSLMLSISAAGGLADASDVDEGDWGRFGVGSWKLVRVHKETVDRDGGVGSTSTRDIRSTLVEVTEDRYTLKVESTVEAAGKRFEAAPTLIKRGYYGETNGQQASVRKLKDSQFEIAGQRIPIEIREVVISGNDQRRVRKVFYSPDVPPYSLKQELVASDRDGKVKSLNSVSEVMALDMPYKVLSQIKTTAFMRTVQQLASGERTISLEVLSAEIPGGVVARSSKALEKDGSLIERTTLELLDYEALAKAEHRPSVSLRRLKRARRRAQR